MFKILIIALFFIGCSSHKPEIKEFYMASLKVKETPVAWQYKDSKFETPFISNTGKYLIAGILFYENEKIDATVNIVSVGNLFFTNTRKVFNCENNETIIAGQKVEFPNEMFVTDVQKLCIEITADEKKQIMEDLK